LKKTTFMAALFIAILTATTMMQLYTPEVSGFTYGGTLPPDADEPPPRISVELKSETVADKNGELLGTLTLGIAVGEIWGKDGFTMSVELKSVSYQASWQNQTVVLYSTPNNYEVPPY